MAPGSQSTRVPGPRREPTAVRFFGFSARVVVSFLVAVLIAAVGIYCAWPRIRPPGAARRGRAPSWSQRGINAEDIADRLKERRDRATPTASIVAPPMPRLHGWPLKAGEYEFPAGASAAQVLCR